MLMSSWFFRNWKHKQWTRMKYSYSTLRHSSLDCVGPNIVSINIAISKYVKSRDFVAAQQLFDEMPKRTVASWNTMISGYSKSGRFNDALSIVSAMRRSCMKLNESTFSSVLSACARLPSLNDGKQVHSLVLKSGFLNYEIVGSALLYLYASCFEIEEARRLFDLLQESNELLWSLMLVGYVQCNLMDNALDIFNRMPSRDVMAWTTVISGYSKSGDGCRKALELFKLMRESGEAAPNEFTLDSIIRACGKAGSLHEGRAIHGLSMLYGFEFEHSISCALIGLYSDCDAVDDAKKVHDRLVHPSLNESNVLIDGLIVAGRIGEAESIFNGLIERDAVSYNLMIKGYSISGRVDDCEKLYLEMPQRTLVSSNTMISVYSRNNELDKALKLFEETKEERSSVTWNSMISGYIQNGQHEKALELYVIMHKLSISKTRSTFSALLYACSCLGSCQQGQLLHAHLSKTPFVSNFYAGTALVDMYSKCGSIVDAQIAFISIRYPNVAAWTALINGYAYHGLGTDAIVLFDHMINQGVKPNSATLVGLLSACTHAGLVNEGMRLLQIMNENYGVTPTLEHYTCAVDLLGRSGHLREAEELIKEMPNEADDVIWGALLNACWFWMDMEVGERISAKMFDLEPLPIFAYVTLSNMYSVSGKWEQKMKVRKTLRRLEVKKDPGCSWIELNNTIHMFSVEDRTHPSCNVIYATLEHLTENVNSIVESDNVSIPTTEVIGIHEKQ